MATGVIFDIKKYAVHDGPGIRTTVFMKGCPLSCWWCHNPESQKTEPETLNVRRKTGQDTFEERNELIGRKVSTNELMYEINKDRLFYEESGGGVTFSGGEPMMQKDFLKVMLKRCREEDIHTVVDTSGYTSFSAFEEVLEYTNLFLFDLKLMDDSLHKKYTGVSNKLILENIKKLTSLTTNVRIRVPLIPGISDTRLHLDMLSDFVSTLSFVPKVDVLPYNEICEGKYERFNQKYELEAMKTQSDEALEDISGYLSKKGFIVKLRG